MVPPDLQSIHQIGPRLLNFERVHIVEPKKCVGSQTIVDADAHAYKRTAVFMRTCEQWFAMHIDHDLIICFHWGGSSLNREEQPQQHQAFFPTMPLYTISLESVVATRTVSF